MNKVQPPFTVESKIYKDPQSTNPNEPSQRIIKVMITLNNQNSNDNAQDNSYQSLNQNHTIENTIKPILTISSSYVRESPTRNSQKKNAALKPKAKLVEQITQYEEKIDPDDLDYNTQSPQKRSLGPPSFNSPRYKISYDTDNYIENENYNSNSDNFENLSAKISKIDQRRKKTNIFSRTSRTFNQSSQSPSIKQEKISQTPSVKQEKILQTPLVKQERSSQNEFQENLNQFKKEDKSKYNFSHTQRINSKKTDQFTYHNQKRAIKQNLKQEQFYDEDANYFIDEPPKVPIIFRKNKPNKSSSKPKPYFSTSTLPIVIERDEIVEKPEKPRKFEKIETIGKTERKLNRKILRIPTVNDDLPIFHEDPPEIANNQNAILRNEHMVEEEEVQEENEKVQSFAPLVSNQHNHDNIRRKIDFENSPPRIHNENNQSSNTNFTYINQNKEDDNPDVNVSNEEEDLLVSDDEDDDINENEKSDINTNKNNQNNPIEKDYIIQSDQPFYDDQPENNGYNDFKANTSLENTSKATNSVITPNEITVSFEKPYQQRNRFSKIENQVIFDENPDEDFDQDIINYEQDKIMKPPNSIINKQTKLSFNNQTALDIQSTIPKPQPKEEELIPNQQSKPEKVINVNFDNFLFDENKDNIENSQETANQTQTVITSPTKNETSINLSPIKKIQNDELLNNDNNQVSSLITKESEEKKDDNFWMFIPIDKKKRKKETNITQNMSKVVNVSRNYVKGVQAFRSLSMLLNQHRHQHFIMNLDKENQNLIGIYTLNDRMNQIKKIWGDGPEKATLDDVNSSLLYNPSSKKFNNLDLAFNQDVDAVYLK